jgi:hypothetical protein
LFEIGPVTDRTSVFDSESPVKFEDASVLYPQVFAARGSGDPFPDVGMVAPVDESARLVEVKEFTYSL